MLKIDSIYNSTAIEGYNYTKSQVEMLINEGVTPSGVSTEDTIAVHNLSKAIDYNNAYMSDITESYIKELHSITVSNLLDDICDVGSYKRCKNWIGNIQTASPQETPKRMKTLVDWYFYWEGSDSPIKIATNIKYRFLAIHPFVDGNGRVSRLILDRLLIEAGYLPARILVEDADKYYEALSNSNKDDCSELIIFICNSMIKTYKTVFKILE